MVAQRFRTDGGRMTPSLRSRPALATGAHQSERAAGAVLRDASTPDAVPATPVALAHLEEALDRLSTDTAALPPAARALRWHLLHLATRLRALTPAPRPSAGPRRGTCRAPDASAQGPTSGRPAPPGRPTSAGSTSVRPAARRGRTPMRSGRLVLPRRR